MLEVEREFYEQNLEAWLRQYPGRFVLVKDRELVGVFDTVTDALAEGARRFGLQSFFVRRVEPTQQAAYIPALALGVLNADPSQPTKRAEPGT